MSIAAEWILESLFLGVGLLTMVTGAVLGFQALALTLLYFRHRGQAETAPPTPKTWPSVTVQLPIYNERYVVARLIDAVCALQYPPGALSVQVLDDSTDETTAIAHSRVEYHRARGVDIALLHREHRQGYKAGALAAGLREAPGELIAIFDADFLPPTDFLLRTVPHLISDPGLGMVQARWGHMNAGQNLLTRGQALTLDTHFVVIQTARDRGGLLLSFNGTAGIWRKACIEAAGGWQTDSLAEDLDLSYRAQLRGWRLQYLPEMKVPSQIPHQLAAFKLQQHRWARGGIQVLRKVGAELWRSPLSFPQRLAGTVHLASYLAHPVLLLFLVSLPALLALDVRLPFLPWLSVAGLGPPLLLVASQAGVYPDWKRRLAYAPIQIFISLGVILNNSLAVLSALQGRTGSFRRTPKLPGATENSSSYELPLEWTVWGELLLATYTALLVPHVWARMPTLTPALLLCSVSFAFTGAVGLVQWWLVRRLRGRRRSASGASSRSTGSPLG